MKAQFTVCGPYFRVKSDYSPSITERFRVIPGRQWHHDTKENSFPLVRDVLLMVCDALGVLPWMLDDPRLREVAGRSSYQAFQKVALDRSVIDGHHFHTKPYDHQRDNLARLVQCERWLLADEQGTGKTHAVANRIYRFSRTKYPEEAEPVLILCPKSVMQVWVDQMHKHGDTGVGLFSTKYASKILQPDCRQYLIANYEALLHHDFTQVPWQCVVLDEIHRVKNFTAKTSKIVRKLSARAKYVYGLSGTPAPNGLEDWFGVISAIDPDLLPVSTKTAFEARYCVKEVLPNGVRKISGYRNVEELHAYVASITSRVTKAECLDLPEKVFSERIVRLEGEQQRIYQELKRNAVARLSQLKALQKSGVSPFFVSRPSGVYEPMTDAEQIKTLTVNNILTESLRLLQVVGGFVPSDDGQMHSLPDKAKLSALADVLDETGQRQVVIWCAFREEANFLDQWLDDHYGPGVVLTGETPGKDRAALVEAFRSGSVQYFIATAATGGTGLNGLEVADTEVYYSRDWNLANYLQSIDRLHRIGQKNAVSVIRLIAANTVDEKVHSALDRKATLQEMMLQSPEELF